MATKQAGSIADDAPLNRAHEHAALADDLHCRGDLHGAVIEHQKAAVEYLATADFTEDVNLQATLRRMHMEQVKAADELKRRIALQEYQSRQQQSGPSRRTASSQDDSNAGRIQSMMNSSRPLQDSSMSDRTSSGGESFMLLGGDWSEAGDRFNRFWGNVEGMLERFTQPVAFATAPLTPYSDSGSGDTDLEEDERKPRKRPSYGGKGKSKAKDKKTGSSTVVDLTFDDEGDSSSGDSFYMVPSSKPASRTTTTVLYPPQPPPSAKELQLKEENEKLKTEMDKMKAKMAKMENLMKVRAGQEAQLRDSIMFAKREAQRNLVNSTTFRGPMASMSMAAIPPIPGSFIGTIPHADNATQSPILPPHGGMNSPTALHAPSVVPSLQKRVKELEEEVRVCKTENEKQKAQIARFREKWNNLKESARRKRSQKESAGGVADGVRGLSIKEEDEDESTMAVAATKEDSYLPPGHF